MLDKENDRDLFDLLLKDAVETVRGVPSNSRWKQIEDAVSKQSKPKSTAKTHIK